MRNRAFELRSAMNVKIAQALGMIWDGEKWFHPQKNMKKLDWAFRIEDAIELLPKRQRPNPLKICKGFLKRVHENQVSCL